MKKTVLYTAALAVILILSTVLVRSHFSQLSSESLVAQHNIKALQLYNQLKNKYIKKTNPLIIAWGNRLTFYHRGNVRDYFITSEEYNELKSIAHVTLAIFALFDPINEFPNNKADVIAYKNSVINAEKAINGLPLSLKQKKRQQKILNLTVKFLNGVMDNNAVSQQTIKHFFDLISPLIAKNINEATKIEITLINQQMTNIQHQLTADERHQLFVIIPVSKMPRKNNIMGQYFSKYLNVPVESKRLIYAEGLTDDKSVLSLVGAWQIESVLSGLFFHDTERMKKDLLSDNAKAYLEDCKADITHKMALICNE